MRSTGIPVSIGTGPTKTLAKIVNRLAKKLPGTEGVFNLLESSDLDAMLAKVDVADGIGLPVGGMAKGRGSTPRVRSKRADPKSIRARITVVGEKIVSELNGDSCLDLELVAVFRQATLRSGSDQADLVAVRRTGRAKRLTVFLMTSPFAEDRPFHSNAMTRKLLFPTDYTPDLIDAAITILEKIYRPGCVYQKCGVIEADESGRIIQTVVHA